MTDSTPDVAECPRHPIIISEGLPGYLAVFDKKLADLEHHPQVAAGLDLVLHLRDYLLDDELQSEDVGIANLGD